MIRGHDRAGWFGASDTAQVMGNWDTQTFAFWWLEKLGVVQRSIKTSAMLAGTHYEHRILDALGVRRRDRQIKIYRLRLRVNLDGEIPDTIKEVKTHRQAPFRVTKGYWQQCQVEMFAAGKRCEIVAYQLTDEEYRNYFLPIDPGRITTHPISYDPRWVAEEYLPRLRYLALCLRRRRTPNMEDFTAWKEYADSHGPICRWLFGGCKRMPRTSRNPNRCG